MSPDRPPGLSEDAHRVLDSIAGSPGFMFIKVPEDRAGKNRPHVDLLSPDYEAEVVRVIGLGAERVDDFDEYGTRWTTLSDPEGNVFDIGLAH